MMLNSYNKMFLPMESVFTEPSGRMASAGIPGGIVTARHDGVPTQLAVRTTKPLDVKMHDRLSCTAMLSAHSFSFKAFGCVFYLALLGQNTPHW